MQNQQFGGDGFSSEEEVRHQQIIIQERKHAQIQAKQKQIVKFKIPPPQQIKNNNYSLHADLATGWAPKSQLPVPVPMIFQNPRLDNMIKKLIQHPNDKVKLCYLGPRFQNTFYAWYDKEFTFPYTHILAPQNMIFTNRAFCGQHWQAQDCVIFNSFFQSGNLDCVIKVGQRQYDLFLRVDSNTRGHLHWYNFKVKNLQKLQKYKFNICNFQKCESLYGRGMKPYIFSQKKYQKRKIGWQQSGQYVKYQTKPSKAAKLMNYQLNPSFKLCFQYYTQYDQDQIQMAYCIPYTYTKLSETLHRLKKQNQKNQFLQINKLCTSLGGLQVPLLIIHQQSNQSQQISTKCVIITGRAHPGQSNGSFLMQGFLQFLCGQSKQAKQLRRNIIFKIVPMLNPDGVALGNYRTGISGRDFNRQYRNPDKTIFPQVYAFKKMTSQNKSIFRQNLLMFLDFHGHSIKKNVFMYGPQFGIIQKNYYQCRIFPKIIGNRTKMFRYYSCSFKISPYKQNTARSIFLRRLLIPLSYTIQASNGSYYDHQKLKDVPFDDNKWKQVGDNIAMSLFQYTNLVYLSQKVKLQKAKLRKKKKEGISRKSMNKLNPKKQMVLTGIQDNQVKNFFQQIRTAQQRREFEKVSDDEISQGSSDNEGKQDDLPAQKINQLYKLIKKKNFQVNDKKNAKIKYRTQLLQKQKLDQQQSNLEVTEQKKQQTMQEKVVINTPIMALRKKKGNFFKNRQYANFVVSQEKNDKIQKKTAKVINFSFINTRKVRASDMLSSIRNRKNLFQAYILQKNQKKNYTNNEFEEFPPNNSMVLDLSEINKQKTQRRFQRNQEKPRHHRNVLKQGYSLSFKGRKFRVEDSIH